MSDRKREGDDVVSKHIPARALRRVERGSPELAEQLRRAVAERDWMLARICVDSQDAVSLCKELWSIIPDADKPAALADAISTGDNPAREWAWLHKTLHQLHERGQRVFDGDTARAAYDALPECVAIYRGTVEAEGEDYGVCWTLSRDKAEWFATKHGRFRNTRSAPVILETNVLRDAICGLLLERNEREVLMWLGALETVTRSRL